MHWIMQLENISSLSINQIIFFEEKKKTAHLKKEKKQETDIIARPQ